LTGSRVRKPMIATGKVNRHPRSSLALASSLVAAVFGTIMGPPAAGVARAQGLSVWPVTVQLAPSQLAAALTVINQSDGETSFQVRPFAWHQQDGADQLATTDDVLASPPLGTISAGATQVVRLVLRNPPQGREATYRILLDQIPPPAAPGTVRIALRLSIPIFAEPPTRAVPHVQWRILSSGRQSYLEALNDGDRHETVRDIMLASSGSTEKIEANVSPYILAGSTRRWRIITPGARLAPGANLRVTAQMDAGPLDQAVPVVAGP
jgi:fimbrial chaperone protein